MVIGVPLVVDRLLGDLADKPIGGQDAGEMREGERCIDRLGNFADRLIDGGFVAFVGFARVVLRAIAGQIAAMSLGVFPRLDIAAVKP